jgi:hypothetical protein
MLLDIKLWPQPISSISLHCNSQVTMSKSFSKVYNEKTKHISLIHEYIMELISDRIITIVYVRSCNNLANLFTKCLSKDLVRSTIASMGLRPLN